MNDTYRDAISIHTRAVIDLLLGNQTLQPPMAVMAGSVLDHPVRVMVAEMAGLTNNDILLLEFAAEAELVKLVGINVVAVRDTRYISSMVARCGWHRTAIAV